jgi:hypothetical protein
MFFLAFFSAWAGSAFAVVLWAALGVLFSKRSIIQSAALVFLALVFGAPAVMWYIGAWWLVELLVGLFGMKNTLHN